MPALALLLLPCLWSLPGEGACSLARKQEMDTEINIIHSLCVCFALSVCLLPVAPNRKEKNKKKYFYVSRKKEKQLKARGCVSCSDRSGFASRVQQTLLLLWSKTKEGKKGSLIPGGGYKALFLLLLNLHSWTQLLAPLLLEQLNYLKES